MLEMETELFLCSLLWCTALWTRYMMANSIVRSNHEQNKWHRWGLSDKKALQLQYSKCQNNNKDLLCLTAVRILHSQLKHLADALMQSNSKWSVSVYQEHVDRDVNVNIQIHSSGARITIKPKPCKKLINALVNTRSS